MKLSYKTINFLLTDQQLEALGGLRKNLKKRVNPTVYVVPHLRKWPEKKTALESFIILSAKKVRINSSLKKFRPMLKKVA